MPDLDVRITSMYPPGVQGGIRAYASATIAGCFAVRGIKIVEGGKDGLFMSMPSRKTQDGYKDICFPVTEEFRNELKQAHLSFTTHADGNELELTGNRAGLLLLAKAALGMAETIREDGFHIHLDDLYGINAEGKSILIRKEEQSKP